MFLLRKQLGTEFTWAAFLAVVHEVLVEAGIPQKTQAAKDCWECPDAGGLERTSSPRASVIGLVEVWLV